MDDGRRRLFCLAMQSALARGGKKLATDVAGRRARRSRSSVRPNPFEDAVGVAYTEIGRNTALVAMACAPGTKRAPRSRQSIPNRRRQGRPRLHKRTRMLPDLRLLRCAGVGQAGEDHLQGPKRPVSPADDPNFHAFEPDESVAAEKEITDARSRRWCHEPTPTGCRSPGRGCSGGRRRPLFALAIEAEWRKRAIGVVPALPKARPEGQRPIIRSITIWTTNYAANATYSA
ncbi:hypothetical protein J3R73_003304 [Labrys monachus]|uniref:Uncharacterized protein n=1 Tax=Labrys monachus TaxID=217067 RepID=A0ABU0FGP5_9HYPH|nr:hypothetical protein [Labrys monachus]